MIPIANHYGAFAPLISVAAGALALILVDSLTSVISRGTPLKFSGARLGAVLAVGATVILVHTLFEVGALLPISATEVAGPAQSMLLVDVSASIGMGLLAAAGLVTVWLALGHLPALHIDHGEFYPLVLLSLAGALASICAIDLASLFLGLELMSLPLHALAGSDGRRPRSNEAGLKSFLTGTFASAIILYGIALLYGATGHLDYAGIRERFDPESALALSGLVMLLAGILFKMAAAPFHQWAPDVYEGAPATISGFISVTHLVAAVFVLQRLLGTALVGAVEILQPVFFFLAVLSMLLGSLMALIQNNVKRMLAYSAITHAGFVLAGLALATPEADAAVSFYLFFFLFANLGAFGVIASLARDGREWEYFGDYVGMARSRPALCAAMSLFLLALAGMPGTSGFIARFLILRSAIDADQLALAGLIALTSVVSFAAYLRLPTLMYTSEDSREVAGEASLPAVAALTVCAVAVVYFGFFPGGGPGVMNALEAFATSTIE